MLLSFKVGHSACYEMELQSRGPPAWGLGAGLTTPHSKNQLLMKFLRRALELVDTCKQGN